MTSNLRKSLQFCITGSMVVLLLLSCTFPSKPRATKNEFELYGLWSGVEKDSSYWEIIYTDNVVWSYSYTFGVIKRLYVIEGDLIKKYYLDSTEFLNVRIRKFYGDSMKVEYNGFESTYHRMKTDNYDISRIVSGDSIKESEYISDFLQRMNNWYSKHPR